MVCVGGLATCVALSVGVVFVGSSCTIIGGGGVSSAKVLWNGDFSFEIGSSVGSFNFCEFVDCVDFPDRFEFWLTSEGEVILSFELETELDCVNGLF